MKDNLYNPCNKPETPDCYCHDNPCPPPPCGPQFPQFCPEDKPNMGKPGSPGCGPMPPVPSVVTGMDLYEAMNNLNDRVNLCINNYNAVMAEGYKTLHNMQRAAQENGAYYGPGEVWVEEGYYADESSTYHLVHKACVDRRGEPIRVQLHLAYGNTTNSKIEQKIFNASKVEFADKIAVAIPKGDKGWYGKAIWHGCPIQSADEPTMYTVGFTKSGVMRVYNNGADIDQMLRDTVVDAMGCSGVLIQNGQITDDSYRANIPDAEKQTSRVCMGQNLATREVIWLTVGNENDVNRKGLTSMACAQILKQYGCDIAVELCEGVGSGAMDKGSLMYVPDDTKEPTAYAYWFISRKCFYKSDYERELAELVQNYGACIWQGFLNKKAIAKVKQELDEEIARAKAAEVVLQENIDKETVRATKEEQRIEGRLDEEIDRAKDAEKILQENINKEEDRATKEEQRIESKLDDEIQRAKSEETRIEGKLDDEIQRSTEEDKRIDAKLDTEIQRAKDAEKVLTDNLDKEIHRAQDEEASLHGEIETERGERKAEDLSIRGSLNDVNTDLTNKLNDESQARINGDNSVKAELSARIDTWEQEVVKLKGLMDTLQSQMTSLDTTVTTIVNTVADIETAMNNVKATVAKIISGETALPYVKLAGDTMTGPLNMSGNEISGLLGLEFAGGTHFDEADGKLQAVNGNDGVRLSGADGVDENDFVTKKQVEAGKAKLYELSGVEGNTSLFLGEEQYKDMVKRVSDTPCLFKYGNRYFYVTSKDDHNNPSISEMSTAQLKTWASYTCSGTKTDNGYEFILTQASGNVDVIDADKTYTPAAPEWNAFFHTNTPFISSKATLKDWVEGSEGWLFYPIWPDVFEQPGQTENKKVYSKGFVTLLTGSENNNVIYQGTITATVIDNVMTLAISATYVLPLYTNPTIPLMPGRGTHGRNIGDYKWALDASTGAQAFESNKIHSSVSLLAGDDTVSSICIRVCVGPNSIPYIGWVNKDSILTAPKFYHVVNGAISEIKFSDQNGDAVDGLSFQLEVRYSETYLRVNGYTGDTTLTKIKCSEQFTIEIITTD